MQLRLASNKNNYFTSVQFSVETVILKNSSFIFYFKESDECK